MPNAQARPVLDRDPIDRLIVMAAALLDAPIAAIAMNVGGSRVLRSVRDGLVTDRTQRDCGEAPLEMGPDGTLVILDLRNHPQTANNIFVQGPANCRFYAGASINDDAGQRIGSLCVLDTLQREAPSASVMGLLRMLADQAASAVDQLNLMRAQEEKAELLHLAESLLGLAHWRFDFLTEQIIWSDQVYRIHGLDRATFDPVLHDALAAYHPDDRPIIMGHIEQARATGQGYDCQLRLLRPDGSERLTQSTGRCLMGEDGAPIALFGVFQDITDKHAAERRLRESEERFRLLASNATDIVTECDLDVASDMSRRRSLRSPATQRVRLSESVRWISSTRMIVPASSGSLAAPFAVRVSPRLNTDISGRMAKSSGSSLAPDWRSTPSLETERGYRRNAGRDHAESCRSAAARGSRGGR